MTRKPSRLGSVTRKYIYKGLDKMSMKERRHEGGAEKRRKKKEATVKLQEEIKRTPSLFQLGFTRSSAEDQACGSTAAGSASDVIATDLPSEVTAVQMVEPQDTIDETAKTDRILM
ncbi:hypothetical protein CHS0354_041013 [Potamilus streckersoni]|uniref:Uncharacterized protein n=1 Tax=Potamilus streckersoni TaxID=2493646 RepID=A0AAE0W209_9BIVA|nr:hypothetical protein CHS0354_041013 [Potamilus streckersoni]